MVQLRYSGGTLNMFPNTSTGGGMSNTQIPDSVLNNLFDTVNRVEVINGRIEYRCFWIYNETANKYYKVKLKGLVVPVDAEIAFAVDGSLTPQQLSSEDQTPVGLTFFQFDEWTELEIPIGHLQTTNKVAIWIRRKVLSGAAQTKTINLTINGGDNSLTITQDFSSTENSFDNESIRLRSPLFYTDEDFAGEALLS